MNSAAEKGIKAFLASQLSAAARTEGSGPEATTVTAWNIATAGPAIWVALLKHKSNDIAPELWPTVVIQIADVRNDVQPLKYADMNLVVETPMGRSGITEDTHNAIVQALRGCFVDANLDAITSALTTAANCSSGGHLLQNAADSIVDECWRTDLNYLLAIEEL